MNEPHLIRLREPWERESLAGGGVRYRRYFNTPTGLTPGTTVTLMCDDPLAAVTLRLNDAPLGSVAMEQVFWSCEITRLLTTRNELTIDFPVAPSGSGLPWHEVRLEIRTA